MSIQTKSVDYEDVKLEQQIQGIFKCVTLSQKLSQKALQKAKQLMMNNLKQIASEAINRSICRDGTSTQLEARDLLSAIQSRGDIYKFKIIRTLLFVKTRSQLNQKPEKDVKTIKQAADFDDKGMDEDS